MRALKAHVHCPRALRIPGPAPSAGVRGLVPVYTCALSVPVHTCALSVPVYTCALSVSVHWPVACTWARARAFAWIPRGGHLGNQSGVAHLSRVIRSPQRGGYRRAGRPASPHSALEFGPQVHPMPSARCRFQMRKRIHVRISCVNGRYYGGIAAPSSSRASADCQNWRPCAAR